MVLDHREGEDVEEVGRAGVRGGGELVEQAEEGHVRRHLQLEVHVAAAALQARDIPVRVIAPIPPKTELARHAASTFGGEVVEHGDGASGAVFVDALFGIGLSRPLSDDHRNLVARLHAAHLRSVAFDVPSGVDADSGACPDGLPHFDLTLAFGAWKPAHFAGEGLETIGAARLVEKDPNVSVLLIEAGEEDTHKHGGGFFKLPIAALGFQATPWHWGYETEEEPELLMKGEHWAPRDFRRKARGHSPAKRGGSCGRREIKRETGLSGTSWYGATVSAA